ncbi:hypothetical protein AWZ03_003710 [Drosophila navojoa]|uniref:Uncharacterized protein n=1 Tax=Drosophila navojoa TaxID=7232 RepID=A0A484BMM7_DRONA|nr:hypothetical protein AWZ03_003710 [Drosophila navojoa]
MVDHTRSGTQKEAGANEATTTTTTTTAMESTVPTAAGSSWSKIGSSNSSSSRNSSEACGVPAREQMLKYYVYATLLLRSPHSLRFPAILRSNHNASSPLPLPSLLPPSSTSQTTATTMSSAMATCDSLLACG